MTNSMGETALLLAIDTCGASGSVALGRVAGGGLEVLGQIELAGRSYSATLVSAVSGLLKSVGAELGEVRGIVVANGPGSFTGVRVGVGAVKGLAEGAGIPVVAVSRLEVLSRKSGVPSAALDAHRGEVYLRLEQQGCEAVERLAGAQELEATAPLPARVAVCDEAGALLATAWPAVNQVRSAAPMAADALRLGEARLAAGASVDLALLNGHYLRRSDAEIFGTDLLGASRATAKKHE